MYDKFDVEEYYSEEAARARAIQMGCITLNSVFVKKTKPKRIPILNERVTPLAIVYTILFILAGIGLTLWFGLSVITNKDAQNTILIFGICGTFPVSYFIGTKLSKASPYANLSGENMGEYIWIQADRIKSNLFGFGSGHRRAHTRAFSNAAHNGRRTEVDCIDYLGTVVAAEMPVSKDGSDYAERYLVPLTKQTSWSTKGKGIV